MDIEKLIETLRQRGIAYARAYGRYCSICDEAVTALSTLQAENKRLNKIVCSIPTTPDSGRTVSQYDKEMSMCAYLDDLEAENEKLRAEMKQERAHRLHAEQHADAFLEDCKRLNAELENYRKGHCSEGGCAAEKDRDAVLAELEQAKLRREQE